MSLEEKLKAIYQQYATERAAEAHAARQYRQAEEELLVLNARRATAGLPNVGVHQQFFDQRSAMNAQAVNAQAWGSASPKTWRDLMNEKIAAAVVDHFEKATE